MTTIAKCSPNNNKNIINNTTKPTQNWRSLPSHRTTPSFSSSCSSNNSSLSSKTSSLEEYLSLPNIPSTTACGTGRVPFSWETTPGIPKKQTLKRIEPSRKRVPSNSKRRLPLPPAVSNVTSNKNVSQKKGHITRRDPFLTALAECSKGGDVDQRKDVFDSSSSIWKFNAKSLSTRFGVMNISCKNVSCVAESFVFLPRDGPRRISYDVLKKRSA